MFGFGKKGLNSKEWKQFEDLLTKANDEQVRMMSEMIVKEKDKRAGDSSD